MQLSGRVPLHKDDFSTYDETNDYSYPPSAVLNPCPKVTLYYKDTLIWGTEP